ncbi:hypothetical protein PBK173_000510000, partial [Plasmodium berghei]
QEEIEHYEEDEQEEIEHSKEDEQVEQPEQEEIEHVEEDEQEEVEHAAEDEQIEVERVEQPEQEEIEYYEEDEQEEIEHSEEDEQIEVKHVEQPEQVEVEHVEEDKKEEEKKIIMSMKGEASSLYEIFSHMVMDLSLIMNPNKVSDDELIRIFKDYQDNLNRKYNLGFDTMDKLEKEGNGGIVEPSNNDVELKENANDFLKDTLEISKESGK